MALVPICNTLVLTNIAAEANLGDLDSCKSSTSKETLETVPKLVEFKPKVVNEPKVWSDAPIIEEYKSDSDDEYVSKALVEQEKPSYAFINIVKHVKTPWKVNTVRPKLNEIKPRHNVYKSHSPIRRPFNRKTAPKANFTQHKVNTYADKSVSAIGGKWETAIKASTGNKAYLMDYQDFNGGPVAFGGSKGQIIEEQDFTDTECLVLSPDFKLPDENQILLRVPRQNNMYSFNLENIVPSRGHRQEEGIDYDEVFAFVARIEAIRIFLAFASYMGFIVYQMDVKSTFLYGTIDEEAYVSKTLGFIDLKFLNKMSSMGELTFFLGLQVKQKEDGIFISQDKYVIKILKKFDFLSVNMASTPIETNKPLVKYEEAADVDVHLYRSMIDSLMYLTASRPNIMYLKGQPKLGLWYPRESAFDLEAYLDSDYAGANLDRKSTTGGCQFLSRRLISWQCKKQIIIATSTIEVEYVAAASYRGQVLWIQNQMLDYGFNFISTKIYIGNESTICIVKNPVFHSKTKHIEIRHHFIRDAYEKKLIQVLKIYTDDNVPYLLTKAFDVIRVLALETIMDAQAAKIIALKARIKKLKKKCKPSISYHMAWLKSVKRLSMKKRFRKKESVSKQGRKKDKPKLTLDDSTLDEFAQDKSNGEKGGSIKELVSTARPEDSTIRPDVDTADPIAPPTKTTTTFNDEDIIMAQTLIKMKEEKAKEKGVSIKDIKDSSRLARSILTLKPLPTIDPKDKGKGIEADALFVAKLQQEKRKEYTIKERAKFLAETIAAQRRFRAAQRSAEIKSGPLTKSQLRNLMMTYLKNMGSYKHFQLKEKTFVEIQGLYERQKKMIDDFKPMHSDDVVDKEKVLEEPDSTKVEVKQEGDEESIKKRPGRRLKMKATKKSKRQKTDSNLKEEEHLKTFL
nr:putative ribonuclease H-like domain-containing protein [Tanacetum cinerariifolium]